MMAITSQPSQESPSYSPATLKQELQNLIEQGMNRSQASRHLMDMTQLPCHQLY